MKLLSIALVLFASAPALALPAPTDLNLSIPATKTASIPLPSNPLTIPSIPATIRTAPRPLITDYRHAELAAIACEATRNGVEPAFIKDAIVYQGIIASPTRTYLYREAQALAKNITDRAAANCSESSSIAHK
jgi:hypothetical protein